MQFGKVHGIALFVLGLVLALVLFVILTGAAKDEGKNEHSTSSSVESKMSYAPGIFGGIFLLGGIWVMYTSRRSDEPEPHNAVK